MPNSLLDIDTLKELYPAPDARRVFLRRAGRILRADRVALQRALALPAYDKALDVAHRIQGSTAFLGISAQAPSQAFHALADALARRDLSPAHGARADLLHYLVRLEAELRKAAGSDAVR